MTETSPSTESAALSNLTGNIATTAAQRESSFGKTSVRPTFGFGTVKACGDSEKSGQLLIQADIFGPLPVPCSYVSPVGGGGAGLFALPGIGATVLCANIPSTNPPVENVWIGCLYKDGQVVPDSFISQPYSKLDTEVARNYLSEKQPPRGLPTGATVGAGVPNQDVIYADNNLPNSYVFQHPAGHSLRMTKKVTPQRNQNEIVIRSAMGKRLVLNDAPASKGGNALQLLDADNNGISIYTETTAPTVAIETEGSIVQTSKQGDITSTIPATAKDAEVTTTNGSLNSHIGFSSIGENGTLNLTATKEIILQVGGTSLKLTDAGLTINAPKVNITGGEGSELSLAGIHFTTHNHVATVNIPPTNLTVTTTGTGISLLESAAIKTGSTLTSVTSTGTVNSGLGISPQSVTTAPVIGTNPTPRTYV
jgi:hypothetical protein|tara:strand:+ start:1679 stop:2947 length:1269 start_codon:yes stop_codon:yes gene_type:complete